MARLHDLHLIVDVDLVFPKLTGLIRCTSQLLIHKLVAIAVPSVVLSLLYSTHGHACALPAGLVCPLTRDRQFYFNSVIFNIINGWTGIYINTIRILAYVIDPLYYYQIVYRLIKHGISLHYMYIINNVHIVL